MTYVILTSRPGEFRTEPGEGLHPVEAYDYLLCGRRRARFVIARLTAPTRVRIVEESAQGIVNEVRSKFLPRFDTLEGARRELEGLTHAGGSDYSLRRVGS